MIFSLRYSLGHGSLNRRTAPMSNYDERRHGHPICDSWWLDLSWHRISFGLVLLQNQVLHDLLSAARENQKRSATDAMKGYNNIVRTVVGSARPENSRSTNKASNEKKCLLALWGRDTTSGDCMHDGTCTPHLWLVLRGNVVHGWPKTRACALVYLRVTLLPVMVKDWLSYRLPSQVKTRPRCQ